MKWQKARQVSSKNIKNTFAMAIIKVANKMQQKGVSDGTITVNTETGEVKGYDIPGQAFACKDCGMLFGCICKIKAEHKEDCHYRKAACMPFDLKCDHGHQACPICDPCTCEPTVAVKAIA